MELGKSLTDINHKSSLEATCMTVLLKVSILLRKVGEWSKKWQMPFNLDKCKIMYIGHKNKNEKYELLGKEIESVQQEKDLGVVITNDLKSSNQCIEAVKKAQKLLGYIKR